MNPNEVRSALADISNVLQRHMAVRDVSKALADMGWEKLGSGHFSSAYGRGDLVIKVNDQSGEDGGDAYATWCLFNRGLPAVPDVYRVERLPTGYLVLMQRYTSALSEDCVRVREDLRDVYNSCNATLCSGDTPTCPEAETAKLIRDFFSGALWDLHGSNVMVGPHGLVITDPFHKPRLDAPETARRCTARRTTAKLRDDHGAVTARMVSDRPNHDFMPRPMPDMRDVRGEREHYFCQDRNQWRERLVQARRRTVAKREAVMVQLRATRWGVPKGGWMDNPPLSPAEMAAAMERHRQFHDEAIRDAFFVNPALLPDKQPKPHMNFIQEEERRKLKPGVHR